MVFAGEAQKTLDFLQITLIVDPKSKKNPQIYVKIQGFLGFPPTAADRPATAADRPDMPE